MASKINDPDLKDDMEKLKILYLCHQHVDWTVTSSRNPTKADSRYTYNAILDNISLYINALLEGKTFAYEHENKIPKHSSIIGGRFIIAMKNQALQIKETIQYLS